MILPLRMTASMAAYVMKKKISGTKRFPLVMMLEPLHACNLTCTGCGRIREYQPTITQTLSVDQCLAASDECGAPIVSICGGEPMIYPQLHELVAKLIKRGRFIILCTNGMFIEKRLEEFKPSSQFLWNVHLDGLEKTHDMCVERQGVFQAAVAGIKAAKKKGFLVFTNTTVYKETDMKEIEALFEYLQTLGVDGHQISPGYSYAAVNSKEIFMTRRDIHEKFSEAKEMFKRFKLNNSPIYLEFLRGEREEMQCTAWGNPTYNTGSWKGPCYLITDAHHKSFQDFMEKTPWEQYGHGKDPRCRDCMVHVGYEPSAAIGVNSRLGDTFKMMSWALGLTA